MGEFEFDEDLGEEPQEKQPERSKTPAATVPAGGNKINLFFLSTIGPGEKRQKLLVDDGNNVSAIKQTVGNIFGLDPNDFESYLKAFRYGMPPHGGFGFGIERFLMELLDIKNIRECILFPRDRTRLTP